MIEIKVTVNKNGTANIALGGLDPLNASLILTQVCTQLQANAIQQGGGAIIATPAGLPAGMQLS